MGRKNEYSYDGAKWKQHDWSIGETITEEKVENTETGLSMAFGLIDDIWDEIGVQLDPQTGELINKNSTRIDALMAEMGGTQPSGSATITNSRIDDLEKEVGGTRSAGSGYADSRIDKLETKASAIAVEVYGSDSTSVRSRLDDLEQEIGGARADSGGYDNSRLDSLQTWIAGTPNATYSGATIATRLTNIDTLNAAQNGRLDAIETLNTTQNGRLDAIEALNTTQNGRLDAVEDRATTIENEVWAAGESRLDLLQTALTGTATGSYDDATSVAARLNALESYDSAADQLADAIKAEIGGTYVASTGFTNSRLDSLTNEIYDVDNGVAAASSRLDKLESEIGVTKAADKTYSNSTIRTLSTDVTNIMNELTGGTGGLDNSRIDKIEAELLGTSNTMEHSRLDDIELEIGGTRDVGHGYTSSRIDALESIVGGTAGPEETHDQRLDALEAEDLDNKDRLDIIESEIGSGISPYHPISTRLDFLETTIGGGEGSEDSIRAQIARLQAFQSYMEQFNIADLYSILESEIGQVVKYEYKLPYTLQAATIDLAPGIVQVDNVPKCVSYEEAIVNCNCRNCWDQSFFNVPDIQYDYQQDHLYYKGTAAAFKTAFNNFFLNGIEWNEGVKITFDFDFYEPTKTLRLVYDYGDEPVVDNRAYNNEEPAWRRITFISNQRENGTYYPIYGLSTFFYGLENDTNEIHIRNVQVEVNPQARDVEPLEPYASDPWILVLPETLYGGTIELQNRVITKTHEHITSYNGEDVGDNWISTTGSLDIGAEVVYRLPEDKQVKYNMKARNSVLAQGFNIVPVNKTIIKLNKNISLH